MTTQYLLEKQVEHVLALLTPANHLVIQVCIHTGLRLGDVLAFRTEKLAPRFWITEQKTGKRRMVGLPAPLLAALKAQAGPEWVFTHRLDARKHRTRQAVWKDVKRAQTMLRLPQNIGPHSFRKVYASGLFDETGDMKRVQRALNHSSESVTMIYAMAAELLKAQQLRKVYKRGVR